MDEQEFRSILQLFPVVRSRDHRVILSSLFPFFSGENSFVDCCCYTFTFWDKLRAAAAKKVGEVEAERFCKAFEKLHKKLVYEELDPETAKRYLLNS
ncbi:unnamed protein product [Brassica napus]|uniref:(rape) hypothetical protein n=1 Tax=Brassica napus TaxID=3708 RepID=A0A817BJ47_BRANA|nr:unnamed protein product [Brassica napus]